MITVRVIFLGLIGFVPSPEGAKDLAALLVDSVQAQPHEMACPMEPHVPFVFLLHGKCEDGGRCRRIIGSRARQSARVTGLLHGFRQRKPEGLLWILRTEDLEISGDEDEELDLRNPFLSFLQGNAPGSTRETSYFSWVPSMKRLAKGHAQLRADCRRADPTCPLSARFRIDGGATGACHLFHDPKPSDGTRREVRIFAYTRPDQSQFRQAVADAVMVEFEESGNYVALRSQGLPGRCRPMVSVRLFPDDEGKVTLIVGNLVPPHAAVPLNGEEGYLQPHSDVLFNLLADRVARPVRMPYSETRLIEPGACEEEMVELSHLLARPSFLEYPHAVTACDGISFPKPK